MKLNITSKACMYTKCASNAFNMNAYWFMIGTHTHTMPQNKVYTLSRDSIQICIMAMIFRDNDNSITKFD